MAARVDDVAGDLVLTREDASLGVAGWDVAARPADLRQYLACHPALERFRLRQMAGQNERIESALVDNHSLRLVVGTSVANRDGGFVDLTVICCAPPRVSRFVTPLSSLSTWSCSALRGLL